MKIAIIVGARPQFIKLAPLYKRFINQGIQPTIIHSGQHYEAGLDQMLFEELALPVPHYRLTSAPSPSHIFIKEALKAAKTILQKINPHCCIVFGDTNTTLAGAQAAQAIRCPLAHVEAGMRSGNFEMPEEHIRIFTDQIGDFLFVPSEKEQKTLRREHVEGQVIVSGDIMLDTFNLYLKKARPPAFPIPNQFIVATIHRNFNTDQPKRLWAIIHQLHKIHDQLLPVILPAHPRLRNALFEFDLPVKDLISPPVSYLEMLYLLNNCQAVITDSGGLQKEAYYAQKLSLVPRDETEWTALVDHGYCSLSPPDKLLKTMEAMLGHSPSNWQALYGDGDASKIIVESLI